MMKLVRKFSLCSVFLTGLFLQPIIVAAEEPVTKAVTVTTDVEVTMKEMGFNFKKAMQATDVPMMQENVQALADLVASVQAYQFSPEKQPVFQRGLDKVAAQLVLVQAALAEQELDKAKQLLREVDSLKKQYHKERSPSVWQLLFGG
jgi:soluble cytochrome b562